jgi:hypothetical protein
MSVQHDASHPAVGYPDATGRSYLEWGAVFGGSVVAAGVTIVLMPFGAAIGLSVGDPLLDSGDASWNVLLAGLWVGCVALASMSAGGYLAGRMRSRRNDSTDNEAAFRDGAHGLAVWGTATVFSAVGAAIAVAIAAVGADAGTPMPEPSAEVVRLTTNTSVIFAFATTAGAALSAGAAWWSASIGGQHRDEGTDVATLVPVMFRKRI